MAKKVTSGRTVAGGWTPCVEALLAAQDGAVGWSDVSSAARRPPRAWTAQRRSWGHEQVRRALERMKAAETAIPTADGSGEMLGDGPGSQTRAGQRRSEQGARMWRARANAPKPRVREAFRAEDNVELGRVQTRGRYAGLGAAWVNVDVWGEWGERRRRRKGGTGRERQRQARVRAGRRVLYRRRLVG